MLTTKNWRGDLVLPAIALSLALFFVACMPPGPRALLDGEQLLKRGKYGQAIVKLQTATRLLPTNAQAWNHLGLAYHKSGQLSAALEAYEQARRCDLNLTPVRFNLGCLMLEQDNPQGAVGELTAYTLLQKDSAEGWLKLATAQLRLHQLDSAERSYENALHLSPDMAEAWNGLGVVYTQRKHAKDALNCFNTALQKQPHYTAALLNSAVVCQQNLNNHALALQKYRDYLHAEPSAPEAAAVQQIVHQLEMELAPPPPPNPVMNTLTAPEPAPPSVGNAPVHTHTNPVVAPTLSSAVLSNALAHTRASERNVARPAANQAAGNSSAVGPSRVKSSAPLPTIPDEPIASGHRPELPRKTEPAVQPEKSTLLAAGEPAPSTGASSPGASPSSPLEPAPKVSAPEPPSKVEVVQLPDEDSPKLAKDLAAPPVSAQPTQEVSANNANQMDKAAALLAQKLAQPAPEPKEEKPSALDRLNPATWFKGKKRASTEIAEVQPLPEIKAEPPGDSSGTKLSSVRPRPVQPTPPLRRYAYRFPEKPAPGDRRKAEPLFTEAVDAQHAGRLTEAIDAYRRAIKQDPSFFQAQYNLGLAEYEVKDVPRSLSAYETALSINPTSVNARYNFALALEMGNYFHDAANELEKILEEKPDETRAHFTVASLYAEKLGQPSLARSHYRKVLELEPQHPQAAAIRFWLAANQ